MASDLEIGKKWVAAASVSRAKKGGLAVSNPRFEPLQGACDWHVLRFEVGARTVSEEFTAAELQMCWKDPKVRAEVTSRIRAVLTRL